MRGKHTWMRGLMLLVWLIFGVSFIMAAGCGGGDGVTVPWDRDGDDCGEDYYSCGDPVGGPICCPNGTKCCFGYNTCCDESHPYLGLSRSSNEQLCYPTLQDEGITWDLQTVCGVQNNKNATKVDQKAKAAECPSNQPICKEAKSGR